MTNTWLLSSLLFSDSHNSPYSVTQCLISDGVNLVIGRDFKGCWGFQLHAGLNKADRVQISSAASPPQAQMALISPSPPADQRGICGLDEAFGPRYTHANVYHMSTESFIANITPTVHRFHHTALYHTERTHSEICYEQFHPSFSPVCYTEATTQSVFWCWLATADSVADLSWIMIGLILPGLSVSLEDFVIFILLQIRK